MPDDGRRTDPTPLNPPGVPVDETRRQLAGEEAHEDQDAIVGVDEIGDPGGGGLTGTERYQGYLEAGSDPSGEDASVDLLVNRELRSGETDDAFIAADEGLAYVPPTDPPVVPDRDNPEGIRIAAGTGASSLDEPYDADHHGDALPAEDEVSARVRDALRADAATAVYADRLGIETEGGVVTLRGVVDDLEDSDAVAAIASIVSGVTEVRDETEVEGL